MNARSPINETPEPIVLSVSFNHDASRFICGMSNGVRIFISKDCVRTRKGTPGLGRGIAIAETFDDRKIAIVGGGRVPILPPSKLQFWDCWKSDMLFTLDLSEAILGIRITSDHFIIVLEDRVVRMGYRLRPGSEVPRPCEMKALYQTVKNPRALCCISGDVMALPGATAGQVQILGLNDNTKIIIPAHTSSLRQIALSKDGELIATASEQGTLIRVFSTKTSKPTHEFRRGVEQAIIFGLAISPGNQFVASTSDKGTLHIFDLRPRPAEESRPPAAAPRRRGSNTRPAAVQRSNLSSNDFENISMPSGSSSPTRGAGFYGPPSDIAHTPPTAGPSLLSNLSKLPGLPRAFTDVRSMTSIEYHVGMDPPNWQGQPAYTSTTRPNGQTEKIKNRNVVLPGRPDGKPPKGIIAWDPESADRKLWIIGGGADARWEVFELVEEEGNKSMRIVKRGYRKYLTLQYPEDSS